MLLPTLQGWWCKWISETQVNVLDLLSSLVVDRDPKVGLVVKNEEF